MLLMIVKKSMRSPHILEVRVNEMTETIQFIINDLVLHNKEHRI